MGYTAGFQPLAATLVTQEPCFANDCVINNHCATQQDSKLRCGYEIGTIFNAWIISRSFFPLKLLSKVFVVLVPVRGRGR